MKRLLILIIIVVLAAAGGWYLFLYTPGNGGQESVATTRVTRGDLARQISVTGIVEPQNRLEIKPTISGRIEEVLVREGQKVVRGDRLALMSSTERASLLDAARLNGPEKIAYWEEVYKPSPLLAPIDATVIVRGVEPGQTVSSSSVVLVLSDRLIVKAEVDETDIGQVRLGQKATVTLDAYPKQKIPAAVDHIAYESTVVSNVTIYQVDILPDRIPETFRAGMSAEVSILVAEANDVLTVPSETVKSGRSGRPFVMVPDPESQQGRRQSVETGMEAEGRTEIVSGLQEGDEVLVSSSAGNYNPQRRSEEGGSPFMPSRRSSGTRRSR